MEILTFWLFGGLVCLDPCFFILLLSFFLAMAADPATRHLALEFLTILAEKAPAMLRKLPQFAEAVFPGTSLA